MTIDTTDDATISVVLGANLNAATAAESDLSSLTITDASSVTLKASQGGFGNIVEADVNTVTLDDDETTTAVVQTGDYTGIEAVLAGSESLSSLTIDAEGAISDITVDSLADAVALTSLTINADGLNSAATVGMIGEGDATVNLAILSTVDVTASNGATIDFNGGSADSEEGDINTDGDLVSFTVSADGTGTTVESGMLFADGDEVGIATFSASNGATIDSDSGPEIVNWGFGALTLETAGADSTLEVEFIQDEGGITVSEESTITIDAQGSGAVMDLEESNFGAVDLDNLTVSVGSLASLTADETDVEVDDDIGTIDIDISSNGTFEGVLDIEAAGIVSGKLDVTIGDEGDFAEAGDQIVVDIAGGSDTEVGIKELVLDIADMDVDTTVDTTSTNLLVVNTNTHIEVGDSESAAASDIKFYQGTITLRGDDENTVNISNVLDAAQLDTAGTSGVYGSWTVTTGDGNDTITGGAGADTITAGDGGDSIIGAAGNDLIYAGAGADTITGGDGNDYIETGNGADTVDAGAGDDSIVLTESVSSADVVIFNADADEGTSDSGQETVTSGDDDAASTITGFTAGTDVIQIVATDVESFVHATNTDLGDGGATTEGDGAESFATNVGLINLLANGNGTDEFGDGQDIAIAFASPTTTMTEALFEAALQYNITGTTSADTITGGGLADTITGEGGGDTINGGAGADVYVFADDDSDLATTSVTGLATSVENSDAWTMAFNVIEDFANGSDKLDLATAGSSMTKFTALDSSSAVYDLTTEDFAVVQGTLSGTTFTATSGGSDLLVFYDADATTNIDVENVVLIGMAASDFTTADIL